MGALDQLLGTWDFTMHHRIMSEPVTGQHRYERVLEGAFVLLRCTYHHPDFPDALTLLTDERHHYFDVRGITRIWEFTIDDAGWSMLRMGQGGDFSQRTSARFHGPDVMEATGEMSHDDGATWEHDFTATYRRVA